MAKVDCEKVVLEAEGLNLEDMRLDEVLQKEVEAVPESSANKDKTLMCKFFIQRRCRRDDCNFAHSEAEQREACRRTVCRFASKGTCRQGSRCWYRHTGSEVRLPESSSASSEGSSESGELASRGSELEGGNAHFRKPRPIKNVTRTETESQQDKMILCKFWLRGTCRQTTCCRFAHGEEEQRAACRKLQSRSSPAAELTTEQPILKEIVATSPAESIVPTSAGSSVCDAQLCWADLTDSDVSDGEFLHAAGQEPSKGKDFEATSPMQSYVSTSTASSVCDTQRVECWADLSSDSDDEFIPVTQREAKCFTTRKTEVDSPVKCLGPKASLTSNGQLVASWADLSSDSDDEFSPRRRLRSHQGFPTLMRA